MFGECHGHIFMDGVDYKKMDELYTRGVCEADIRRKLAAYQALGITYFREGGDHYGAGEFAREIALEYGITYRCPIFAIHKQKRYGGIVGKGFADLKEYRVLVEEVKRRGGDFIKVMLSGIMDFSGDGGVTGTPLTRDEIHEMIHIAHEEGFAVMAHVNGARTIQDAVEGGVDSVEHGNFMDDECIAALCESSTIWVPTHVTISNLIGDQRFPEETIRSLERDQADSIRKAIHGGAMIALGSDAGAYRVLHGSGIGDEYDAFFKITQGLLSREALNERLLEGERQIRERFCHC